MKYQIFVNPKIEKSLSKIELRTAKKIRDKIRSLADNPRQMGAIKLKGEDNAYRVRVGDYRIIYEIYDSKILVLVMHIDHRKDVYL